MTTSGAYEDTRTTGHGASFLVCGFEQIDTPGCYIDNRTGTLMRVPKDGVVSGRSPVIELVSKEAWVVTRISEDPYLPVTKARMIASNLDLKVNF